MKEKLESLEPVRDLSFLDFFAKNTSKKISKIFIEDAIIFSNLLLMEDCVPGSRFNWDFLKKNYVVIANYFFYTLRARCFYQVSFNTNSIFQLCSNVANFCGVPALFKGTSLIGGYRSLVYLKIIDELKKLPLDPVHKKQLSSIIFSAQRTDSFFSFGSIEKGHKAVIKSGVLNKKSVKAIKAGNPVIIPIGYQGPLDGSLGHFIDVVFCRNEFVICNRGAKHTLKENVLLYTYKPEKLNFGVIKYLLFSFLAHQATNTESANLYQQIYLYEGLPKILDATPLPIYSDLKAKDQKVDNCPKANTVLSFRIALFYLLHNSGIRGEEAALKAREHSKMLSVFMRKTAIKKVKDFFIEVPESEKEGIAKMLAQAESKVN
jgi:hypothetical protein